jgi:hypothetical protein
MLLSQTVKEAFSGWCKMYAPNIYYYLFPCIHYFRPKILHSSTVYVVYFMMLTMFPKTTHQQRYIPYMLFLKRI